MTAEVVKIFKTIGLISLIFVALVLLGNAITAIIPWIWITNFFIIMRNMVQLFDFMVDTDTLWILVGLSLIITSAYWALKAVLLVVRWFREH